jgi:hypothetical protein
MNNWEYHSIAIVEADDFCNRYDRNGLNYLFYWKSLFPKFKITLFTIPDKTTNDFLCDLPSWIEIAVHGFNHESNFECYGWDYSKTTTLMNKVLKDNNYIRIFKSPGWSITPDYNGYPASSTDLINKDKQGVYKALRDLQFTVVDRHYNRLERPEDLPIICIDCNPDIVHFHTWSMDVQDINERNGFEQVEKEKKIPWDNKTNFYFLSEALEKRLIKPCLS